MRRLALIAAAGLVVAGCGGGTASRPAVQRHDRVHYPVVVSPPAVSAVRRPAMLRGADLHNQVAIVSPHQLGLVTSGSGSCPTTPDRLTVLSPTSISVHLSIGTYRGGHLVADPHPGACTADRTTTTMLVAINSTQIDVYRPLTVRLFYTTSSKPEVRTATPLTHW